jgi:putative FmdB family regulatory protein
VPTYQYQCTECGEGLEAVQKFTDDALTVCPSCDGRLKKVFSAVGIVFKGSGFYRNDSRGASSSSTPASSTSTSSSSPSKSGSDSSASSSTSSSSTSTSSTSAA